MVIVKWIDKIKKYILIPNCLCIFFGVDKFLKGLILLKMVIRSKY